MNPVDPQLLHDRLSWPVGRVDMVLDTDTYNEIDDQFALVYALLSGQRINLEAVYAAPFHNGRSSGPGDGMEKSYDEIRRVLEVLKVPDRGLVFRGSTSWLPDTLSPVESAARDDLIERARSRPDDRPLYVMAIGAITNVVSAILQAPDIREKIVVLWLGGHPLYWPSAHEFNLRQDPRAARVLFDCGVPLVWFPCRLVAEAIKTTLAELEAHLAGGSPIGQYLTRLFREYENAPLTAPGASKEIWDLAPFAWLLDESWCDSTLVSSPILIDGLTWGSKEGRHPIRAIELIRRDKIFTDLFAKIAKV